MSRKTHKKMKKGTIIKLSVSLVLVILIGVAVYFNFHTEAKSFRVTREDYLEAYEFIYNSLESKELNENSTEDYALNYYEYSRKHTENYTGEDLPGILNGGQSLPEYDTENRVFLLEYEDIASYTVEVETAGLYYIQVNYKVVGNPLTSLMLSVTLDDASPFEEAGQIDIPLFWEDTTKDFPLDTYGDDALPSSQKKDADEWKVLDMYNNEYYTSTPLRFYFTAGTHKIDLKYQSSNAKLVLGQLSLKGITQAKSYSEYISQYQNVEKIKSKEYINGIDYSEKNSSYIRMKALNSATAKPFSVKSKKLNVIDGDSWKQAGQSVSYEIEVAKTGLYNLAFHYRNNKEDYDAFRSIYINGEIPFSELESYSFPHTGSKYANETLHNKSGKFYFYFEAGQTYTITLKAETAPVAEELNTLQLVIDHINQLSLAVLKITGNDIDKDRTYDMTSYFPQIPEYLKAYQTLMQYIIMSGSKYSSDGVASASLSYVQKALTLLKKPMKYPDKLPLYLEQLYSGSTSVNQMLGDSITKLTAQNMFLEGLYVYSNSKLPSPNCNFLVSGWNNLCELALTFFSDKYKQSLDNKYINVWVSRPVTYIGILQQLVDSKYNSDPNHKTKIKISSMPDASKLTLAVAAGNNPDIALGLASYMPFDLGIRSGAYDLSQFDDFWEVADRFAPGTLVAFNINDAMYALPETVDFNALIYRTDVFSSLQIDSNLQTWDDIIGILPTLQRYGMNFYLPIAADNSTKWFFQTAPFIYQYGGSLYTEDGLSANLNTEEAIAGLDLLTSLFSERSLSQSVPSFYNSFRYAKLPAGIVDFAGYLKVKNAAPEIAGKWKIQLQPGVKRDSGEIDRTYIANGTSAIILKNTDYPEECWDFLKWWTSTEIQSEFAYLLQSTYGPEYVWLSSNIDAIKDSNIDAKDKEVILESLEWITDIPRTPGQYMLERSLSNIWTSVVLNGEPVRVMIQEKTITINREIKRKMEEFGFLDGDGNVIVEYHVHEREWVVSKIEEYKTQGGEDGE